VKPDADPPHVAGASGGAYLEILPDTRATHGDKLIQGENFTDKPGVMAVLHYKVNINTPGRYYVWVRSFSTGSEDNGVHVGLNGQWPESGQRWQTVQKQKWAWDCKQRTQEVHTGVPMQLFLDIEKAGEHEIMFSMREDGFEMDKFVLASNQEFTAGGQGSSSEGEGGPDPRAIPRSGRGRACARGRFPRTGANRQRSRRAMCGRCRAVARAARVAAPARRQGSGGNLRRTQGVAQGHADARRAVRTRAGQRAESLHGLQPDGDVHARVGFAQLQGAGLLCGGRQGGREFRRGRHEMARAPRAGQGGHFGSIPCRSRAANTRRSTAAAWR
jgi:hypothetical protein